MEVIEKVCTKCGKSKPLDEYWNHPTGKFGKRPRCIECVKKENAEFEESHRETRKKQWHDWYENNKLGIGGQEPRKSRWKNVPSNKRRANLKTRYGISVEEYDRLFEEQCGNCGLCGEPFDDCQRRALDHDHKSGKVRGIIHYRCNLGIAIFNDSPDMCRKAADYLERNKV